MSVSISEHCLRVLFSFFFAPPQRPLPSWIPPLPGTIKTLPFPRGNAIFRGWGAGRVLGGVTTQKKEGVSLKNGAQKLVRFWRGGILIWKCFNHVHVQKRGSTKFSVFLKRVSLLNPRVRTNFVAFPIAPGKGFEVRFDFGVTGV